MKRTLSTVLALAFVASCQTDRPSVTVTEATGVAPSPRYVGSASISPGTPCSHCTYAQTFTRERGAPVTDTIPVHAVAGIAYVVDVDDLDSQGADASVELNGTSLMRPGSAAHDSGSRHVNEVLVLANLNTLVVRLVGKPGSQLRVAIWLFRPVTLDAVTLAAQSSLQLEGPGLGFAATITNHTKAPIPDVAVQAWLVQLSARRAASGSLVVCGAAIGVLPPGTCVRPGNGILASNASAGFGTLIPGNAQAVIQVVGLSGGGVLDSLIVPVVLTPPPGPTVLGVTVNPKSVMLKPGDHATLTADVQVSGGAPTTVTWSTSNAAVATVSASGVVTGIAPLQDFSAHVTIVARSTADPTKADSSQVAVVDWRITSPDVPTLVSTGATLPASNPLSVVIQASVCPQSMLSGAPFSRADFFAMAGGIPVLLGSNTNPFTIMNGTTRCIVWSFTWTPGSAFGVGPQTVYATGVNDAGATVVSPANTKITTVTDPAGVVVTGIKNIQTFLDACPTSDPAYAQIRQDFELRLDGQVITAPVTCSGSISALPIDQLTDELIALQVLRTAFYMSQGTEGKLPWTTKSLYAWMASDIAGVNLKTAPGQLYCCDIINGKRYFSTSRQDATQRDVKRTWIGISGSVNFYAHEIRHADAGAPGHTTGCPAFPLPTDPAGCDATYDLSNLGSYGVQYWLESHWATGMLNIGIGCSAATAQTYAKWDEGSANSFRSRFVTNPPPVVTANPPYGGPCLP